MPLIRFCGMNILVIGSYDGFVLTCLCATLREASYDN